MKSTSETRQALGHVTTGQALETSNLVATLALSAIRMGGMGGMHTGGMSGMHEMGGSHMGGMGGMHMGGFGGMHMGRM